MARAGWVALVLVPLVLAVVAPAAAQRSPLLASVPSADTEPRADTVPPVEPPSLGGIDERCAEGAEALWRGRAADAERIARAALAAAGSDTPTGALRHAVGRCHALLGRALLAGGSRDPSVHASADVALRRGWELAPSADLIDDLVSAHWMGSGGVPLPIPAHDVARASAAERAAIMLRGGRTVARTLRTTPTAGGPTWSVVQLETPRAHEVVAVACRRGRCVAEPLFAAWTSEDPELSSRSLARIAVVGFVPLERGLALVVDADHRVSGERAERVRPARTEWDGSALYVRWIEGGGLAGWNVLTRSRLQAWDRALGDGPPTRLDVRVRWGRHGVVVQPSGLAARRLAQVAGLRDPRALGCDRCWLGDLRPGQLFLPAP